MTRVAFFLLLLAWPIGRAEDAAPRARAFPHAPESHRDAADPSCAGCHGTVPSPGTPPEQASLHMGPEGTCTMCHRGPAHAGAASHLEVVVPEARRASLPDELALLEDGRIACFTCHEPHPDLEAEAPRAVERGARPLAAELRALAIRGEWTELAERGATWPPLHAGELPVMVSLPVDDGALCRACHGAGPGGE